MHITEGYFYLKMSAIKSKHQHKVILDFSDGRATRSSVRRALRNAEFASVQYNLDNIPVVYVDHEIQIGQYRIELMLNYTDEIKALRDYGKFGVEIFELSHNSRNHISLNKDPRFKSQYWLKLNQSNYLNICHLTDIILHCNRLNKLNCFL